ncbi:MAG: MarR family winged helix-turn-helix transcriptional regulator [Steroidobacteraceae bacterium]
MSESLDNMAVPDPVSTHHSEPDDQGLYIGYLVTGVRTRMMQEMDGCLLPYGLTAAQFIILRRIAEGVATTAAELCRVLEYDTGSMTRMLDRLEEKCVIARERSSDDRRVVNIQLTVQGAEQYPSLKESVSQTLNRRFAPLNEQELLQLRDMLERLSR